MSKGLLFHSVNRQTTVNLDLYNYWPNIKKMSTAPPPPPRPTHKTMNWTDQTTGKVKTTGNKKTKTDLNVRGNHFHHQETKKNTINL